MDYLLCLTFYCERSIYNIYWYQFISATRSDYGRNEVCKNAFR